MDELSYTISSQNTTILLWVAGGVAFSFIVLLIVDSFRRRRRRASHGRHGSHDTNFITRSFRRSRHFFRNVREALDERQRYKARTKDRHR